MPRHAHGAAASRLSLSERAEDAAGAAAAVAGLPTTAASTRTTTWTFFAPASASAGAPARASHTPPPHQAPASSATAASAANAVERDPRVLRAALLDVRDHRGHLLVHNAAAASAAAAASTIAQPNALRCVLGLAGPAARDLAVDARDAESGWTPAHTACYYGRIQNLVELLRHGATLSARDWDGELPADLIRLRFAHQHPPMKARTDIPSVSTTAAAASAASAAAPSVASSSRSSTTTKTSRSGTDKTAPLSPPPIGVCEVFVWGSSASIQLGGVASTRAVDAGVRRLMIPDVGPDPGPSPEHGRGFGQGLRDGALASAGQAPADSAGLPVRPGDGVVATGKHHSLFVTRDGRVRVVGAGKHGVLGLGKSEELTRHRRRRSAEATEYAVAVSPEPVLGGGLDAIRVRRVAASVTRSAAIGERGELFLWGGCGDTSDLGAASSQYAPPSSSIPQRIVRGGIRQARIASIALADDFWLAVDSSGNVWGCGDNSAGALALDETVKQVEIPRRIAAIYPSRGRVHRVVVGRGVPVGGDRSGSALLVAALLRSGDVLIWGGPAGRAPRRLALERAPRTCVPARVVDVAVGDGFVAAVTATGRVHVCASFSPSRLLVAPPLSSLRRCNAAKAVACAHRLVLLDHVGDAWDLQLVIHPASGDRDILAKPVAPPARVEGLRGAVFVDIGKNHAVCMLGPTHAMDYRGRVLGLHPCGMQYRRCHVPALVGHSPSRPVRDNVENRLSGGMEQTSTAQGSRSRARDSSGVFDGLAAHDDGLEVSSDGGDNDLDTDLEDDGWVRSHGDDPEMPDGASLSPLSSCSNGSGGIYQDDVTTALVSVGDRSLRSESGVATRPSRSRTSADPSLLRSGSCDRSSCRRRRSLSVGRRVQASLASRGLATSSRPYGRISLMEFCEERLFLSCSVSTVLDLLQFAVDMYARRLQSLCLAFLRFNFDRVLMTHGGVQALMSLDSEYLRVIEGMFVGEERMAAEERERLSPAVSSLELSAAGTRTYTSVDSLHTVVAELEPYSLSEESAAKKLRGLKKKLQSVERIEERLKRGEVVDHAALVKVGHCGNMQMEAAALEQYMKAGRFASSPAVTMNLHSSDIILPSSFPPARVSLRHAGVTDHGNAKGKRADQFNASQRQGQLLGTSPTSATFGNLEPLSILPSTSRTSPMSNQVDLEGRDSMVELCRSLPSTAPWSTIDSRRSQPSASAPSMLRESPCSPRLLSTSPRRQLLAPTSFSPDGHQGSWLASNNEVPSRRQPGESSNTVCPSSSVFTPFTSPASPDVPLNESTESCTDRPCIARRLPFSGAFEPSSGTDFALASISIGKSYMDFPPSHGEESSPVSFVESDGAGRGSVPATGISNSCAPGGKRRHKGNKKHVLTVGGGLQTMSPTSSTSSVTTCSVLPGGPPCSIFLPNSDAKRPGPRHLDMSNCSGTASSGFNPSAQNAGGAWGLEPIQPRKLSLKPALSRTRSSDNKNLTSLAIIQQEQELEQKHHRARNRSGPSSYMSSSSPCGSFGLPPPATQWPNPNGRSITPASEARSVSGRHSQLSAAAVAQRSAPRKIPGPRRAEYAQVLSTGDATTVGDGDPSRNAWASTPGSSLASCRSFECPAGSFREIQKAEEIERMTTESASPYRSGGWTMLPGDYRKSAKDIRLIEEEELANRHKCTSDQRSGSSSSPSNNIKSGARA